MDRKQTDFIGGLAKGLRVIEAFTADSPKKSISDIAAASGLDRAAARRCLLTLTELGYADYDGKFFRLTPRILRLGTACLATMPLPSIVQPMLDELSQDIGQSSSVSILDDWEIVYVARAAQRRVMSINLTPGSRMPASCASMGRVLLAALPVQQVRDILSKHPPARLTPKSITAPEEIIARLKDVREQGFAINDQEIEIGLRSIAVPLYDSRNRVVAAINVGVAAVQDDPLELRDLYLNKLLGVQQALKPLLT